MAEVGIISVLFRRSVRCLTVCAVAFLVLYSCGDSCAEDDNRGGLVGPVPLRIVSPLRLWFFQFAPERAESLGDENWNVRLEFSESNILHPRFVPFSEFDAELNHEITRLNLGVRYGVTEEWDLGIEVPYYYIHDGFLDGFIEEAEELFGSPKIFRTSPREEAFFLLKFNQASFYQLSGSVSGIGDIAFTTKYQLLHQDGWQPGFGVRGAIKVPTGEPDRALGSGHLDVAVGVAAEYEKERWGIDTNLNVTYPFGNRFEDVFLETQPIVSGHLGGEYRTSKKWSWHLQFAAMSGPFAVESNRPASAFSSTTSNFTGAIFQVTPALAWRPRADTTFFLGFVENLLDSDNAAADFTFFLTMDYRFGG